MIPGNAQSSSGRKQRLLLRLLESELEPEMFALCLRHVNEGGILAVSPEGDILLTFPGGRMSDDEGS